MCSVSTSVLSLDKSPSTTPLRTGIIRIRQYNAIKIPDSCPIRTPCSYLIRTPCSYLIRTPDSYPIRTPCSNVIRTEYPKGGRTPASFIDNYQSVIMWWHVDTLFNIKLSETEIQLLYSKRISRSATFYIYRVSRCHPHIIRRALVPDFHWT